MEMDQEERKGQVGMDSYDSGKLTFENESVVITDPAYLISKADKDSDVWEKCDYGSHMERVGFTKFFTSSNGFGDGDWTVTNKKNGKKLGEIWADSGQTGIYLLDEVAPDSPIFYPAVDGREFGAVILKNFTGEVSWKYKVCHYAWDGFEEDAHYLILEASGKCGDEEIEFSVDFDDVDFDDDEEENSND